MAYIPTPCPANVDLDGLRRWVEAEFLRVAQATITVDNVRYNILYKAPEFIVPGMTVFADGTVWNPGGGTGLYQRSMAGAWVKL